jgi:hypothetical protein
MGVVDDLGQRQGGAPFRTVKEVHETLFHFHKPKTSEEASTWLMNPIPRYHEKKHWSEPHSRIEAWIANLLADGIGEMCAWEPQRRRVGGDAPISVNGITDEVDPEADRANSGRCASGTPSLFQKNIPEAARYFDGHMFAVQPRNTRH